MAHHYVMMSLLRIEISKIDKFGNFLCDIDYNSRTGVFRDVIPPIIDQCHPRRRRAPPVDTKCPPAALCNQAKRACY